MSIKHDDFLSLFTGALRSVAGWALVILLTMLAGIWLGHAVGHREFVSPFQAGYMLILSTFAWLLYPSILLGYFVSGVGWYLSLRIESTRLQIAAATCSFTAWFAIAAWVFP